MCKAERSCNHSPTRHSRCSGGVIPEEVTVHRLPIKQAYFARRRGRRRRKGSLPATARAGVSAQEGGFPYVRTRPLENLAVLALDVVIGPDVGRHHGLALIKTSHLTCFDVVSNSQWRGAAQEQSYLFPISRPRSIREIEEHISPKLV
jgi:hypothetical protein